ncbi:uncharacterized protein Nmag_0376 [Natrialba magadii ATCC 43099]|uniref:Uncharacterized protein n=1 Tax=Natrialba magadii (strain ATCC 43099 / DSM 3394 / CCM 3739 / CIP 104546 / IAM 13178 / JCM 8861 / NBRC 102185 / NCIMB 2190 / MS3) TaxID=547559 RepID=D3SXS6_NATMM|nr:uncharacterized protein Nmag_0376 [Natrialba magadii ATCC 43099]
MPCLDPRIDNPSIKRRSDVPASFDCAYCGQIDFLNEFLLDLFPVRSNFIKSLNNSCLPIFGTGIFDQFVQSIPIALIIVFRSECPYFLDLVPSIDQTVICRYRYLQINIGLRDSVHPIPSKVCLTNGELMIPVLRNSPEFLILFYGRSLRLDTLHPLCLRLLSA